MHWVIDVAREERFGPFTDKKLAAKVQTAARKASDIGLEHATNVGIMSESDLGPLLDLRVGQYHMVNGKIEIVETKVETGF